VIRAIEDEERSSVLFRRLVHLRREVQLDRKSISARDALHWTWTVLLTPAIGHRHHLLERVSWELAPNLIIPRMAAWQRLVGNDEDGMLDVN